MDAMPECSKSNLKKFETGWELAPKNVLGNHCGSPFRTALGAISWPAQAIRIEGGRNM